MSDERDLKNIPHRDVRFECPRCESYATRQYGSDSSGVWALYLWACLECGMKWEQFEVQDINARLD